VSEETAIETINDEVRFQRAIRVLQHRITHGSTIRAACQACGVPERTFYDWVRQGVLDDYVAECKAARSETARAMAAEALPDVMRFMIDIATGKRTVRGANPIAAAQFVYAAAGGAETGKADKEAPPAFAFMPQTAVFNIAVGSAGPSPVVLEGEVVDGDD